MAIINKGLRKRITPECPFKNKMKLNKQVWTEWIKTQKYSDKTKYRYSLLFDKLKDTELTPENIKEELIKFINQQNNGVTRAFLTNTLLWIQTMDFPQEIKVAVEHFQVPKIKGRKKKRLPRTITETEAHAISKLAPPRSGLMILLGFYCGLRVEELTTIKPYNFRWDKWLQNPEKQGTAKIIGKGNKERIIYIPAFLMKKIHHYLTNYIVHTQTKDDPIFFIHINTFVNHLEKASNQVLDKPITPHILRYSCGSWLFSKGIPEKMIKELLGHESINTTDRYISTTDQQISQKYQELFK